MQRECHCDLLVGAAERAPLSVLRQGMTRDGLAVACDAATRVDDGRVRKSPPRYRAASFSTSMCTEANVRGHVRDRTGIVALRRADYGRGYEKTNREAHGCGRVRWGDCRRHGLFLRRLQ